MLLLNLWKHEEANFSQYEKQIEVVIKGGGGGGGVKFLN